MSKKLFTEEQVAAFRQNPYVYSVTSARLVLTKEFKELFIEDLDKGLASRQILENHGFNTDVLGDRRIMGISQHIKAEYREHGGFHDGYRARNHNEDQQQNGKAASKPLSEGEQLRQLQNEIEYLKQEMEFLKKISSIRTTRK